MMFYWQLTKERIKKEAKTAETTKVLLDTLENHMKNGGYVHYEVKKDNQVKVHSPVLLNIDTLYHLI